MVENAGEETSATFEDFDFDEIADVDVEEPDMSELSVDIPEEPYWRIEKRFMEMLFRVVGLVAKSNVDMISKSVHCAFNEGRVVIKSTDKDVYFVGKSDLKNDELRLENSLVLDSRQLVEVIKNSSDIILYVKDGQPYVNLLGGYFPLEKYKFDESLYSVSQEVTDHIEVDATELLEELNILGNTLSLASRVEDKKIVIKDSRAFGQFLTVATSSPSVLPDMVLRARDIEILRVVLSLYGNERIKVATGTSDERTMFVGEAFSYASTKTPGTLIEKMKEGFEEGEQKVYINGTQIFRILHLLDSPQMKMTSVRLIFSSAGVSVETKSRKGVKSAFTLSEESNEDMTVEIQVSMAKKVFHVMKEFVSISLEKKEDKLFLSADKLSVVMGIK